MSKELSMGRTVLCVSKTSPAQITRNMILERAGYKLVATGDPAIALGIFTGLEIDAVVVGDSIPAGQRIELALKLKSVKQAVPIVALSNSSGSQFASGIVDEQLESLGDPHLLLDALQRVLARTSGAMGNDAPVQKNQISARND
jgi:CheY-like chemotaxis protein